MVMPFPYLRRSAISSGLHRAGFGHERSVGIHSRIADNRCTCLDGAFPQEFSWLPCSRWSASFAVTAYDVHIIQKAFWAEEAEVQFTSQSDRATPAVTNMSTWPTRRRAGQPFGDSHAVRLPTIPHRRVTS
jgi:hypothetical protein